MHSNANPRLPDGVVEPGQVPSVGQFLLDAVHRWPDQIWCTTPIGSVSRRGAVESGYRVANGLRTAGLARGERVLVALPNSLEFLFVWFGAILGGFVPVAMNPKAVENEAHAVLTELSARALITSADFALNLGEGPEVLQLDVRSLLNSPAEALPVPEVDVNTPVTFLQSSGSTGRPKLIAHSHKAQVLGAEGFPYWLGLTDQDVLLTALPLAHGNAQIYSVLGSFSFGAKLVLLPQFSARSFWQDAAKYGATEFNAVGAMIEILMRQSPVPAERAHRVRLCYTAPAMSEEQQSAVENRFHLRLVIGYAQSEGGCAGLTMPLDKPQRYGSIGVPRQHPRYGTINAARIVGHDGAEVAVGGRGELELWTATPTPGYLNMPAETEALFHDGWLRTGDLASVDADGYYYFGGRIKELIRHKGEMLSPVEVEIVLESHPSVAGVAVVGVPSDLSEEDIKAFVVPATGVEVGAAELAAWCSERLPKYKRPRYLEFVDRLPLTDTNKVQKFMLARDRTEREHDLNALKTNQEPLSRPSAPATDSGDKQS